MQKFGVQLALEHVREARVEWAKAHREFQAGVDRVMAVLLHEAARNYMSAADIVLATGMTRAQIRRRMTEVGLDPKQGKRVLADRAAKALNENAELLGIDPSQIDLMSPLAYLPMGDDLRHKLQEQTISQVTELPEDERHYDWCKGTCGGSCGRSFDSLGTLPAIDPDGAFYTEHYGPDSGWTVEALPLTVYVPTANDGLNALDLVRGILTDAGFDIRIKVSGNPKLIDDAVEAAHRLADQGINTAEDTEGAQRAAQDYQTILSALGVEGEG